MLRDLALNNIFNFNSVARTAPLAARKSAGKSHTGQSILAAGLIAVNVVLLASYLVSVNGSAASGYEIKKMRTELATLTEENQKLNVKVSEISSMVSIQDQVLSADFVPAGTPQFLQQTQLTRR